MSEEAAMAIADLATMREEIVQLSVKLAHATERNGYLERTQAHAEAKSLILEAQLGGWEAACAAQVEILRDVQTFLRYNVVGTAHVESLIGRIEKATETNAGELLLVRLAKLEDAVRQAGHARGCALQYGGVCSCRMQLVRH